MKKLVITSISIIVLSLLAYFLFDNKTKINSIPSISKSTSIDYDTLFSSIDNKLESVIKLKNESLTNKEITKMISKAKLAKPSSFKEISVSQNQFSNKDTISFYLVSNTGYITNKYGAVIYVLTGTDGRYYYEITLKTGFYTFQSLTDMRDTVSFVVDKTGAYKLGFQENHRNFTILRDSLI